MITNRDLHRKISEDFWVGKLSNLTPLPFYKKTSDSLGKRIEYLHNVPAEALDKVALGKDFNKSLLLLAALYAWICQYTNNINDITVATSSFFEISSDPGEGLLFVSATVSENNTVKSFLKILHAEIHSASQKADYDFANLIDRLLTCGKDSALDRFVNCGFFFDKVNEKEAKLQQLNLVFSFEEDIADQLVLKLTANEDFFDIQDLESIADQYSRIFKIILSDLETGISNIGLATATDVLLIEQINNNKIDFGSGSFLDLFNANVKINPGKTAVVYGNKRFTYEELDCLAEKLALYIRGKTDIKADDLIGVIVGYSEWRIISILAILKTGAGYVPIKAEFPLNRIAFMLSDCGCKVVLFDESFAELAPEISTEFKILLSEDLLSIDITQMLPLPVILPESVFVVLYTSGSSGLPKGVLIEHRNIYDRLLGEIELYGIDDRVTTIQSSNYAFDSSLLDLFLPLVVGGKLVIPEEECMSDYEQLAGLINTEKVSDMQANPNFLKAFIDTCLNLNIKFDNLQRIWCGGESLNPVLIDLIKSNYGHVMINNHYGPTEGTIDALVFTNIVRFEQNIIGKPIYNMSVFIVNDKMRLQPINLPGEICISGNGIARGYLNLPELTKEKFITNPFEENGVLYKTGDLGRLLKNGNVEYLGRIDDQIKIRGYRIELAEIENVMLRNLYINEVVVIPKTDQDGMKFLVSFLVVKEHFELDELRGFLKKELPDFMVPSYFIILDSLPLTATGKIDKKALSQIENFANRNQEVIHFPQNEVEEKLLIIWKKTLQKEVISTDHNFFDIGGHSLKATQLLFYIFREFEIKFTLREIFSHSTIRGLSLLIQSAGRTAYISIPKAEKKEQYAASNAQKRMWLASQFHNNLSAYNLTDGFILEGEINPEAFEIAYNKVLSRHAGLRTVFFMTEDDLRQKIVDHSPLMEKTFSFTDVSFFNSAEKFEYESKITDKYENLQFDLKEGPLIKADLVKLEDELFLYLFSIHHIVADEWSLEIFKEELLSFYNSFFEKNDNQLSPLPIQYIDYSEWKNSSITNEHHEKFWQNMFLGDLPNMNLPFDFERTWVAGKESKVRTTLGEDLSKLVRSYAKQGDSTVFITLFSLFNVFLYKICNQKDIVVGTITAGRDRQETENLIGLFVNTLAIRTIIDENSSFILFSEGVKDVMLNAFQNQDYEFEELVSKLKIDRNFNRHPLFDVLFEFQNYIDFSASNFVVRPYDYEMHPTAKFDLAVSVVEKESEIEILWTFNDSLFEKETLFRLSQYFIDLCRMIINRPEAALKSAAFQSRSGVMAERGNTTLFNDEALFDF
ncbi:amino acid adenylation domain-containing protein [Mucilaginibacter sp. RCC_168]|uniref:amino acid adenylation domain-containing protein n=1 Tax=Mucilaginibacter sp. RCC_168 TaxID=3239221 RepID=UPI0035246F9F